jgi:hypothetical protein
METSVKLSFVRISGISKFANVLSSYMYIPLIQLTVFTIMVSENISDSVMVFIFQIHVYLLQVKPERGKNTTI